MRVKARHDRNMIDISALLTYSHLKAPNHHAACDRAILSDVEECALEFWDLQMTSPTLSTLGLLRQSGRKEECANRSWKVTNIITSMQFYLKVSGGVRR